jgi:hypothetical protein
VRTNKDSNRLIHRLEISLSFDAWRLKPTRAAPEHDFSPNNKDVRKAVAVRSASSKINKWCQASVARNEVISNAYQWHDFPPPPRKLWEDWFPRVDEGAKKDGFGLCPLMRLFSRPSVAQGRARIIWAKGNRSDPRKILFGATRGLPSKVVTHHRLDRHS